MPPCTFDQICNNAYQIIIKGPLQKQSLRVSGRPCDQILVQGDPQTNDVHVVHIMVQEKDKKLLENIEKCNLTLAVSPP